MKLLLIDGHSLAYRAFFAMPRLSNSQGQPTGAVLGVANMIFRILKEENPTHLIVFFDRETPQFRLEAYKDYKAQRPETPDDLASQMPLIRQFFQTLGTKIVEEPGFEADDWIAAIVKQAESLDAEILILSGDLDLLQLVSGKTSVLVSKKGISDLVRYNPEEVHKRYSLEPHQLVDLKALIGDPSDNIKGAVGIGEKGAIKLLGEWGSLENLLNNKDQLAPKTKSILESSQELLAVNKTLVSLRTDAPIEFRADENAILPYDAVRLREFLEKLEFKNLISRLKLDQAHHFSSVDFTWVDSEETLTNLIQKFQGSNQAGLKIWPPPAPFLGKHHLVLDLPDSPAWVVAPEYFRIALQKLTSQPGEKEIFTHNWKSFLLALKGSNLSPPSAWNVFDLQIAGWLVNSLRTNPSLAELARDHLGISIPEKLEEAPLLLGHWGKTLRKLGLELSVKLQALQLQTLYDDIELPLIPVLAEMEWEGVAVDLPYLAILGQEFKGEVERLEREIYQEAGTIFNINSPKQLAEVLYGKLNLPKGKKTKSGFSTDVDELERLAEFSPLAKFLLEYREVAKLQSTYVEVLPQLVDPERKRLHTTYLQTGTATGRLASKDPNLQNIPIRTEYGRKIRKAFTAGHPGWKILSADYSQIELRLLAHFSKDPVLCEAFAGREDIHQRTASEVFNVSHEAVTSDMRRMAKVVNFGIIYGMTEHGLSESLGMTKEQARDYIRKYLDRFPQIEAYIKNSLEEARHSGVTRTLFGRLRLVPELQSEKSYLRRQAERMGINAPLQGTVADLMKLAMIRVQRRIKESGLSALMVMQVHDELVFEVRQQDQEALAGMVKEEMENIVKLDVPLSVDLALGDNWAEMTGTRT